MKDGGQVRSVVFHFSSEVVQAFLELQKYNYEAHYIFNLLLQIKLRATHRPVENYAPTEHKLALELLASLYSLPTTPTPRRNKLIFALKHVISDREFWLEFTKSKCRKKREVLVSAFKCTGHYVALCSFRWCGRLQSVECGRLAVPTDRHG